MIGTQIRGFHHLHRLASSTPKVVIFRRDDGNFDIGEVIAVKGGDVHNHEDEVLYFYNNVYGEDKPEAKWYHDIGVEKSISSLNRKWPYALNIIIKKKKVGIKGYANCVRAMWLMPNSFYDDIDNFYKNNKKQFGVVERKFCDKDSVVVKCMYAICNGSKNYFFWGLSQFFANRFRYDDIKRAVDWANNYNQLCKNLKKGTVTGYTSRQEMLSMLSEMTELRRNKRINNVINSFNTTQKHILKNRLLSIRDKEALAKFDKLSKIKKVNFIRKMSTVNDGNEIMMQMGYLVNVHFEWNKKSLIDYIQNTENFHAEIVSDNGDIVLVKVYDYEAVKYLGKSTNWCISKNKTYWNQYFDNPKNTSQYIIFNFSKPEDDKHSIIGFTSKFNNGITHAHDFVNHNLMTDKPKTRRLFKSFMDKFNDTNGIYGILEAYNIKLCDVTSYSKEPYEWNRNSFIQYLNSCVDENNYDIIYDSDNKLAIIVNDPNIKYFFGMKYMTSTDRSFHRKEHFIFADFSMDKTCSDKMVFGVVDKDEGTNESYVQTLFNRNFEPLDCSFDYKLNEYHLPYDIICRKDDNVTRFIEALDNLEIPTLELLLDKKEIVNNLHDHLINKSTIYESIYSSILARYSYDLIKLLYDRGFTLTELMGEEYVENLCLAIFIEMRNIKFERDLSINLPSKTDLKAFDDGLIDSRHDMLYIGWFKALDFIASHERSFYVLKSIFANQRIRKSKSSLLDYFANKIYEQYKESNIYHACVLFAMQYAKETNNDELFAKFSEFGGDILSQLKNIRELEFSFA